MERRRDTFLNWLLAGLLAAVPVTAAVAPELGPERGWAHKSGLVRLQDNGVRQAHDPARERLLVMEAFARWGMAYDEG